MGSQTRGNNYTRCCIGTAELPQRGNQLLPGSNSKCQSLVLPPCPQASPMAVTISGKAPVCRCHFPSSLTTRHKACCLCSLQKRRKTLSPNLRLTPFLKARYGLCLVLPACFTIVCLLLTVSPGSAQKAAGSFLVSLAQQIQWLTKAGSVFLCPTDCHYETGNI